MFAGSNLKNLLAGGTRGRELRETRHAWEETQALWQRSLLGQSPLRDLSLAIVKEAAERAERRPAIPVLVACCEAVESLFSAEQIGDLEARWDVIEVDTAAAVELRQMLVRRKRWSADFPHMHDVFRTIVLSALDTFFNALPESCFGDWDTERNDIFEVPLIDLFDDPAEVVERLFMLPYADDSFRFDIFNALRELGAGNLLVASGFPRSDHPKQHENKLVMPTAQENKTGAEIAGLYLQGSPLKTLIDLPVPFYIPEELRFEHCHIVGGTGHGKTQLMQKMIHADLAASREDGRSVIVIDSQGDLINKLVRLDIFSPNKPDNLADRLVLIDPADVEYPAALNLFDAHLDRVRDYSAADKERVLNGVIELYELFFGAFLGAELTQKQGVVFKYLARLMLAIPDATIHTLMRIMEDGKSFKPYMDQLDGSARYFFETEFFHPSFAATKKQVLRRLWGVLSTPAFERIFTQKKNKLDLFEAMNEGKIILVSTAKDLLKREGSQLLGRFVIAMIAQAALERSTLSDYLRRPCFVYIDEAQEYFDDSIETILNQARKYHVGLTLAHQTLDQLSPRLRSAILSNTSMKCAGGVSAKDARALADELRTTSAFIEGMKRRGPRTEFAVWVKHLTGQAIRLSVPLGFLERQPTLDQEEYDALLAANRERCCGTLADVQINPAAPALRAAGDSAAERVPRPGDDEKPLGAKGSKSDIGEPHADAGSSIAEEAPAYRRREGTPPSGQRNSNPPEPPEPAPEKHAVATGLGASARAEPEFGKGGKRHRYLQSLVKELAEQAGLKATIEAPLAQGGEVDVLLERDGLVAAVEISVSTAAEHERANVLKCLRAGVPLVCVVVTRPKQLAKYEREIAEGLAAEDRGKVRFVPPEGIPDFIGSIVPPAPTDTVVKGYRVRVSHVALSPEEAKARREALSRIVAKSLSEKGR